MRRGVASGLVADARVRRIRFLGWWHQTLRHLLVSGGSSFVGGSIRPSGGCSKRQVLELACIFASEPCRQGPRASLHVSPNTVLDTWIVFVRKSKQQMISVLCPVSCSTASFKHVLFVVNMKKRLWLEVACPEPVGSNTWQTQPPASEMSMFGQMPSFTREPAQWLFQQDFWLNMKLAERESWLQHRESVAMQHEDVLFLRTLERSHMEQQDVIEMSHYHWDNLDHLMEYQHAWRILGGGPCRVSVGSRARREVASGLVADARVRRIRFWVGGIRP